MILSAIALMAMLDWNEMASPTDERAPCKLIWKVCLDKGCEGAFGKEGPFENKDFLKICQTSQNNGSLEEKCFAAEKNAQEGKLCSGKLHYESENN